MGRGIGHTSRRGVLVLAAGALLAGCMTTHGSAPARYSYFGSPDARDPWSPKIAGWQSRERALPDNEELLAPASVSGSALGVASAPSERSDLRGKYLEYRAERKRAMARDVASWIQKQARRHYVEDGPIDHWATLEETLRRDGDDCDGLELLVYHFLRDLGFSGDEVFRAIVYRPEDGQHHMVTLWFEDAQDPWVIDPTGAMVTGMPRMSEIPGWVPIKVFSEDEEYTVRPRPAPRTGSTLAASRAR